MSTFDDGDPQRRATDGLDWGREAQPRRDLPEQPEPIPAAPPPPPMRGTRAAGWVPYAIVAVVASLLGGLVAAFAVVALTGDDDVDGDGPAPAAPAGSTAPVRVEQTSAIAEAVGAARGGVIKIESTRRAGGATEQDVGSGVVLDQSGHILTNAHVVLGTETLQVVLPDGTQRPAILVGHDYPFTDLAVLQVGPGSLTPLEVGDSEALKLGEAVIAIGNPLAEFEGSVSTGVVSGLNRTRLYDGVMQYDLIQTDAALNNGNSGGALLNLQGQFIGMPTSVLRETRGGFPVEGIGFALPSNRVMEVARGIIAAGGQYPRPSLGLEHLDLNAEVAARSPGLRTDQGALVVQIAPGGPAATAGIATGDVVTQIGDEAVGGKRPLLNALMAFEPGETVRVVLNRDGRIIETEVRLGTRN